MFVEVTREKMVGCFFVHPLPHHEKGKGKGKASPGGKRFLFQNVHEIFEIFKIFENNCLINVYYTKSKRL